MYKTFVKNALILNGFISASLTANQLLSLLCVCMRVCVCVLVCVRACVCTSMCACMCVRVESGSDDPDNVGHLDHFVDGSSGSHPQTKLSGCEPDFLVH